MIKQINENHYLKDDTIGRPPSFNHVELKLHETQSACIWALVLVISAPKIQLVANLIHYYDVNGQKALLSARLAGLSVKRGCHGPRTLYLGTTATT